MLRTPCGLQTNLSQAGCRFHLVDNQLTVRPLSISAGSLQYADVSADSETSPTIGCISSAAAPKPGPGFFLDTAGMGGFFFRCALGWKMVIMDNETF